VIGPRVADVEAVPPTGDDVMTNLAAAPMTLKALLVAPVRPLLVVASVYPIPALLIDRLLNVATPFAAVLAVVVPDSVPPGFVPIVTVTDLPATGTASPAASLTVTATAGLMAVPALVFDGCPVNSSLLAVRTITVPLAALAAVQL